VQVTVRLFALARQRAGRPEVTLDLPEPATVGALKRALADVYPELAPIVPSLLIAVAAEYAHDDLAIAPGAEVAAIPPVSGGSDPDRDALTAPTSGRDR
jgi:molybdopterin converting factor subunit 1